MPLPEDPPFPHGPRLIVQPDGSLALFDYSAPLPPTYRQWIEERATRRGS